MSSFWVSGTIYRPHPRLHAPCRWTISHSSDAGGISSLDSPAQGLLCYLLCVDYGEFEKVGTQALSDDSSILP